MSNLEQLTIYRFQGPSTSAYEFNDIQLDSDREIGKANELEINSNCLTTSEQSSETDSDCNIHFADITIDPEYIIFPISLVKADKVCVRLNDFIQSSRIPKDKIL